MGYRSTGRSLVSFQRHGPKAVMAFAVMLALATGTAAFAGEGVTYEMEQVTPYEFRGDVRDLAQYPLAAPVQKPPYVHPVLKPPRTEKVPLPLPAPEALSMNVPLKAPLASMPTATVNFAGMSFSDTCTGGQCGAGWPPDTNGDVGPNHYIQAVNSAYAIYSKTGSLLASFTEDSLWSGSGSNPCNGNSEGDPIVLYDQLTDRWILTHFAFAVSGGNPVAPFYQCIAVSKTGDPVSGGWWLYPLRMDPGGTGKPPVGTINDYTKFGIWTDCLYMSANEFAMPAGTFVGTSYASLSRNDLERGAALTWSLGLISNATDPFTMIPSTVLGFAAGSMPPAGTPNYFVSESQTAYAYEVRKFAAGPNCGAGGTLGAPASVSQTSYSAPSSLSIVPQPGTSTKLDMIDDRLMQKVRYRKMGITESLWVVHNVYTSSGLVAPQWAQIDVTGGTILTTPAQQEIYTPDTSLYRWMGSLAVDNAGNMALGYSTSSAAQYPSIAYSGRLVGDAANTLPQTEKQMVAGAGSQTLTIGGSPVDRWGDYTAMSMDPFDDCTFWYTNQYYSSSVNGSIGNWQTRIGSFTFPSCPPVSPSAPAVTTAAVTGIKFMTATGGGNVIATGGGGMVLARGVCWNTIGNPTISDICTTDGSGTGPFTSSITGLSSPGLYYVRAYATNSIGTGYGNEVKVIRPDPPSGLSVK